MWSRRRRRRRSCRHWHDTRDAFASGADEPPLGRSQIVRRLPLPLVFVAFILCTQLTVNECKHIYTHRASVERVRAINLFCAGAKPEKSFENNFLNIIRTRRVLFVADAKQKRNLTRVMCQSVCVCMSACVFGGVSKPEN